MLSHRGCRLGITQPEIYKMQVEAVFKSAIKLSQEGLNVKPEIMIPLIADKAELDSVKAFLTQHINKLFRHQGHEPFPYEIGTMIELPGTVTPRPQDGNPQPRLFRLPEQQAIINRMGFNNHGIDAAIRNIEKSAYRGILGINIGKNAVTPIENAADDYLICLEKAYAHADYITVNISSPNTKNLRALQVATN